MSRDITPNINSYSQGYSMLVDEEPSRSGNNSYSCWKVVDLIPYGNKKSNFKLYSSIGAVILIFLLGFYLFSLTYSVEENHSSLQMENATFHYSRIITYTNGNYTNTTRNPLIDLDVCLKNMIHPFEGIHSSDKCIERPIEKKWEIHFIETDSVISDCLISVEGSCYQQLRNEKQRYINLGFTHTCYDFYIGGHGKLFEGRPLTCHVNENDKAWDYVKKQIVIGIPQCDKLYSNETQEKNQFNFVLKNLLACLDKEGLLSAFYKIYIPRYCKHYFDYTILADYKKKIKEDPPSRD